MVEAALRKEIQSLFVEMDELQLLWKQGIPSQVTREGVASASGTGSVGPVMSTSKSEEQRVQ